MPTPSEPLQLVATSPDEQPPGFNLSAGDAVRVAVRVPEVRHEFAKGGPLDRMVAIPGYTGDFNRWQVTYYRDSVGVVEVHIDSRSGRVLEVWTGPQVDFIQARPQEEKMGGSLNEAWVWIPLSLLFLAPFVDPRRPFRLLHLDLLVLLGFGVAQVLFNAGELDIWVPAVYPLLGYLLVRMLYAGFRPRERFERLIPFARDSWLLTGLLALIAVRIVLNVVDSTVIDVGYASVVGADGVFEGQEVVGYGPLTFLAYVPFEWIFPWNGTWDSVPAAHAAAIVFDLGVIAGLQLLGRALRPNREGRTLGLALAYAWAAFPYSAYVLQSNTNDGLVVMLMVFAVAAVASPGRSGALVALASAAKLFPAALAPLLAAGTGERRRHSMVRFGAAFAGVGGLAVLLFLPDGGVRELWDNTVGYQLDRKSPFTVWGLHPSLDWLQTIAKVATVGLCAAVAFVPRRRDARQVAALAAAVLIALQISANHWFFFYVTWFAPFVLAAVFAAYRSPSESPRVRVPQAPRRRDEREPVARTLTTAPGRS